MTINFRRKFRWFRTYQTPATYYSGEDIYLSTYESDRGRIINSAAIRRLQQKTQVFPLERNASVRSRLTHSLEVQQNGRYITQKIFDALTEQNLLEQYGLTGLEREFESIVEMSCLMHDIGNPPFGHFGEKAIIDWFETNLTQLVSNNNLDLNQQMIRDLCSFEGNAQAIRLVHTLLNLGLTYTQVSGILKYTRRGDEIKPNGGDEYLAYLRKKVGYYISEQPYIADLMSALDIDQYCRSPFSYIMEAADDISYGLADLEDAVEKGIISIQGLKSALIEEYLTVRNELEIDSETNLMASIIEESEAKASSNPESLFFVMMRVGVGIYLIPHARDIFIANIDEIYEGTFNRALLEDGSDKHAIIETMKNVAAKYAFSHKEVEARELQGYQIIKGLLDTYSPILSLTYEQFERVRNGDKKAPLYASRLYKKLPKKHVYAYEKAIQSSSYIEKLPHKADSKSWEFYFRVRLIQDYISGMTDQFAFDEYRAFSIIDSL
ncbi:Deoxyguanosinetriphosphate triphosphohydrolase [Vibrio nigripulchritudo SFn27]|uniref:Probable deoxyguanosinetriphosphate triphosphohydrolase n=2 Tax=Vibrio nigripulchritudo TaxID=28173 RepID=U4K2C8_9VIBR|nr:dGTPase [Vibrio nigripulchritudo]CCN81893.1 Deoxyguanosinetriphosphate triphosphohydrolase [Vibrio nigripulchritudo BLFn1]CCN88358.1 Deoxyguanosinetriphosphate triphosphohydrolase [Vibrio nigripulchritudo SFn27]CCN95349.1 Deoxyguanosinetriphosphate triphosphohydrolase [Vibrio nigripulchritudo ENn2]CCO41345.1 Deoxyguanosinetriphosphate triphosphohydrolase [Vibrio nigripulchritudo SFn135]CCO45926.1 Deoxyguanosinetriphosphate triphosphohydrolase [Vibrio nigripulchritudo SOn1]